MEQEEKRPNNRVVILFGLVLALVPATFNFAKIGIAIPGLPKGVGPELMFWVLAAVILLYVLVVERRPLSSIGLKRLTWRSVIYAVGAWIVTFLLLEGIVLLLFPLLHLAFNTKAMQKITNLPYWFRFLTVLRAGVCEELIFRGYGISRLEELTGNKYIAVAVTLCLFVYAHLAFWGMAQIFIAGGAGLVLSLLYLWRRDLGSNMIAHWLTDAAVMLTK